jgi:hypothetical protein
MSKRKIEERVKTRVKGEARKKRQQAATLNEKGQEILDERPLFHDLGFKQPETLNDKIRRITAQVQSETAAKLAAQNMTQADIDRILDEEDDFEIPEDFDNTMTQYEQRGMLSELEDVVDTITFPAEQSDEVAKEVEDLAAEQSGAVAEGAKATEQQTSPDA